MRILVIWALCMGVVANVSAQNNKMTCVKRDTFIRVKGLERTMIGSFWIENDSTMLVGTNNGLWRIKRTDYNATPFTNELNTALKKQLQKLQNPADLLCFHDGDGLYQIVDTTKPKLMRGIANDKIAALVTLSDSLHYLVGQRVGIARLAFDSLKVAIPKVEYKKIFKKYEKKGIEVWASCPASASALWLGTSQGVFLYDMVSLKLSETPIKAPTYTFYRDTDSSIWIGGYKFFGRLHNKINVPTSFKVDTIWRDKDVFAIDMDKNNKTYWIAAQVDKQGKTGIIFSQSIVCNYEPTAKKTTIFDADSKIKFPSGGVRAASIVVDTLYNNIWVGTLGSGIYILPIPTTDTCRLQMLDTSFVVCMGNRLDTMKFDSNKAIQGLEFEKNKSTITNRAILDTLVHKLKILQQCSKDTFIITITGYACLWKEYGKEEILPNIVESDTSKYIIEFNDTTTTKLKTVSKRDSSAQYFLIQNGMKLAKDRGEAVKNYIDSAMVGNDKRFTINVIAVDCFSFNKENPPTNGKEAATYLRTDINIKRRKPKQQN